MAERCLFLFTKPARPGRVKTRLIGELSAEAAAELHAAFLGDLVEELARGDFELRLAWALEPGEPLPTAAVPGVRQEGTDLGDRLYGVLRAGAERWPLVAAAGSDHPELTARRVEEAFDRLAGGADVVLGPARDGGYYLIGLRAAAIERRLFAGVPWSSAGVLAATLERCRRAGRRVALLPEEADVDRPEDLSRLAGALAEAPARCPRTRRLLAAWGRVPAAAGATGAGGARRR